MTVKAIRCRRAPLAQRRLPRMTLKVGFSAAAVIDEAVCMRKRHFATEGDAREAGSVAESSKPLYAYRCPSCEGWHLTSSRTGRVIEPKLERLFPGRGTDYGNFEHEDDDLFSHLHNYGWGR